MPLATPLHNNAALDIHSLQRLTEHVVGAGVDGLFVLGSTGETASLSVELRCSLVRDIARFTRSRVPLVVNVSDTVMEHTFQIAGEAARSGAFAVALSPPCYFPLDQRQLSAYIAHFCHRSPLPVFLYNIPQFAHTPFEPATVIELARLPNVVGLKNSDGSLDYLRAVQSGLDTHKEFSLMVGNEETLLAALRMGADGGVCGGANVFPQVFVELIKAAAEGRETEAERLQQLVLEISAAVYHVGASETSYLRGLKRALKVLGLTDDILAQPIQNFEAAEQAELDSRFARVRQVIHDAFEINHSKSM